MKRVPIFVCGEPTRGDDAAGFAALELLPAETRSRAEVVPVGQLDVQLLLDLPDGAPCVVVDAVAGLEPGSLYIRPLADLVDAAWARAEAGGTPALRSSHELPLEQALALAAILRPSPPQGTFVGLGGARFDLGSDLTPAVRAALPVLAAAIAVEVERFATAAEGSTARRKQRAVPC
jgi:hydrogenase maturation protease